MVERHRTGPGRGPARFEDWRLGVRVGTGQWKLGSARDLERERGPAGVDGEIS